MIWQSQLAVPAHTRYTGLKPQNHRETGVRMNIVMFSESYLPYINGAVTHIAMLHDQLTAMGHQVYVVTVSDVAEVCLDGYIVRCPGHNFKSIYNYRMGIPCNPKLDRLIASLQPDILHMHNEFSMGLAAVHLARKLELPLVYTLHSDYKRYISYLHLPHFERQIERVSLHYLAYLARRADTLISPSSKVREYLPEERVGKRVTILPNAVDQKRFDRVLEDHTICESNRRELDLNPDCLALVFLGRLGPEKSVLDLLDSFAQAPLRPDEAQLFFIGDGPEKTALEAKISDLNLREQVHVLGSFPNSEIPALLSAMDLYVSASVSEMHAISLLEAAAAGLPALVKLDPPNAWQIEEGKNGYTWTDTEDFVKKLSRHVQEAPAWRKALKQATLTYARAHGIEEQSAQLVEIYEETIARYQSRSVVQE